MCIHHSPFLAETIPLAEHGRGFVAPNPMVGALVVKDGRVIATGYHRRYGERHAEAVALDDAAEAAQGATLYCNLEPCSFTATDKHQPPCTRRIIEAGVDTVVVGQLDPNPRVRGDGVRQLEAAGISVIVERDDQLFRRFNDVFNTVMTMRRPFVHLKTAMSLDGRIATTNGVSEWITDEGARREVHALRAERDAVLVGVGTVLADDPLLTVRATLPQPNAPQPIPIVLDTHLRTPPASQLVDRRGHELIIVASGPAGTSEYTPARGAPSGRTARGATPSGAYHTGAIPTGAEFARRRQRLESRGVTVLSTPPLEEARVDIPTALQLLYDRGIASILVEGGAAVTTSFLRSDLYDRLTIYIAPIIIGAGTEAVGDLGTPTPTAAPRLTAVSWRTIGDQQVCDGYHPDWFHRTAVAPDEATRDHAPQSGAQPRKTPASAPVPTQKETDVYRTH